ncbi:MAG: polyamine aminopropyltransferase [Synergistaceae bacterium]|nr:polyamine aminopropyltransferase [Synergistaceae bacterium]
MSEYVTRPKRNNDLWLREYSTDNLKLSMKIKEFLHSEKTPYQELLIADTYEYGKVLMLDGAYQLTEKDEFTYSEMMAHVPLCAHKNPEKVLIIGGGDGAIMREVLKHDCVKKCTLIDIDERVIECSKKFLPFASCSFGDERADVKCIDAMKYIRETSERYDVVIIDSTDPVDFAAGLFQSSFYSDVKRVMNDDAMLSELTESPFTDTDIMLQAIREMRKVFPIVKMYWGVVPTYPSGMWTYGVASMSEDPSRPIREVKPTKYYTQEIHKSAFILPPFLADMIKE